MDVRPCPAVVDAVATAVSRGDTGYAASGAYAAALAELRRGASGAGPRPRHGGPGRRRAQRSRSPHTAVHRSRGPGRGEPPVYNAFYDLVAATGRSAVDAPLTDAGRLDLEVLDVTFARLIAGGQRAVYLLSNPHNPTGTVHSADELSRLAASPSAHGVRVLSDEIHAPLVFDDGALRALPDGARQRGGITVTSASKAWNLAGLKAAMRRAGRRRGRGPRAAAALRRPTGRATSASSPTRPPTATAATGCAGRRRARRNRRPARRPRSRHLPQARLLLARGDLPRLGRPAGRWAWATTRRGAARARRGWRCPTVTTFGGGGRRPRARSTSPPRPQVLAEAVGPNREIP